MGKKSITFIINPISGVSGTKKKENAILNWIDKSKFDYRIEYTQYAGHATVISAEEVKRGTDIIVAVGGDGSVNEIARELINSNSTLGIVPAGSGNGLAHHLGISVNLRKAIEIINKGNTLKMDTGKVNEKVFVSLAGIGFDGLVAAKYANSKIRGFLTYMKIATEEYNKYKPKMYSIEINGKIINQRALFIIFANSNQFGYNAPIAPEACVSDGLLDVVISQKPLMVEMPLIAGLMYWRKIDKTKYVEVIKSAEIIVKSKKRRWVNIDGEAFKMDKKIHVKVIPNSLNIIVP
jgi:YegS/Rv2252/BmrU family lipid kinase